MGKVFRSLEKHKNTAEVSLGWGKYGNVSLRWGHDLDHEKYIKHMAHVSLGSKSLKVGRLNRF